MIELALLAIVVTVFAGMLLAIMFVSASRMLQDRRPKVTPEPVPDPPPAPQRKGALQRHMEMHG